MEGRPAQNRSDVLQSEKTKRLYINVSNNNAVNEGSEDKKHSPRDPRGSKRVVVVFYRFPFGFSHGSANWSHPIPSNYGEGRRRKQSPPTPKKGPFLWKKLPGWDPHFRSAGQETLAPPMKATVQLFIGSVIGIKCSGSLG